MPPSLLGGSSLERLQALDPDEQIPVVIWMAGYPKRPIQEYYTELAQKYPEAGAALELHGNPVDVSDAELNRKLEQELLALIDGDIQRAKEPLLEFLGGQGHLTVDLKGLPAVAVTLPKAAILGLENRPDVGTVYLNEAEFEPALQSALPSSRVPPVWQRGIDGNLGVRIGILEPGKIDFSGHGYLHTGVVRACSLGADDHKTSVASVAASYHTVYTGAAPGVSVDDWCTDTTATDIVNGLAEAVSTSDPVNFSGNFGPFFDLHWTDKAFDYRALYTTVLVGAGNVATQVVASPGKGWNVVSVGAIEDKNSGDWADDEMASFSSWHDAYNNNEKPELVATGTSITHRGIGGTVLISDGTSLSTPIVAGIVALMFDRHSELAANPRAVKAILMASAVHNVAGPSVMPSDQDLKDGAGAIDASLADTVAKNRSYSGTSPCAAPCWWGLGISEGSFTNSFLYRHFRASRGERIRVAIAWPSNVYCPNEGSCGGDSLDLNLDLSVQYLNESTGQWVDISEALSASWHNSSELVEFIAPSTAQYRINVYKYSGNANGGKTLGIAWVRDATYLPDLRNKDGWVSEFSVCNQGAESRRQYDDPPDPVYIYYFESNGAPTPKDYDQCDLYSNQCCWIAVNDEEVEGWRIRPGTTGSAIVDGGEDITVVVEHQKNSMTERTNYTGILPDGSSGSQGWEQAGSTLYAPVIKRQRYGRSSSIHIANSGSQRTKAYVYYYDSGGTARPGGGFWLEPGGSVTTSPSGSGTGGCNASNTICSARIYSNNSQPLAAVVREYNVSDGLDATTHNVFNDGATSIYFPIVKYARNNMSTGLRIQNVGSGAANITVYYYAPGGGAPVCSLSSPNVARWAARTFYDSSCPGGNFLGSAVASASQPLVGMANEVSIAGPQREKGYSSFLGGGRTVYGPLVYHLFSQGGHTWDTGIAVQNVSISSASVNLTYYHSNGSWAGSQTGQNINGLGTGVFFAPVTGFKGSVVISANRDVVAGINVVNDASSGDTEAIYNASNR
jgi:hypothetical protein